MHSLPLEKWGVRSEMQGLKRVVYMQEYAEYYALVSLCQDSSSNASPVTFETLKQ